MKMDIVESDLRQLFMWIKNLDELCKSQQVLIEVQDERLSNIEHDLAASFLVPQVEERRLSNIEHDLALVLSVIKDRKDST